jgi:nucleotide-binding universal stress UspA family protein
MFKRIVVAYDESPESGRALLAGIHLAKSLSAELRVVAVQERQPLIAVYSEVGAPGETNTLRRETSDFYRTLLANAQQTARGEGLVLLTELVEGPEVQAIVEHVERTHSDLLIMGLHHHASLLGRLWNHTAHDVSQQVGSSILGVH